MKIHQLPYGARFRYQGEEYVKTGPMFGTGRDGQKIFPRHLVLEPLDQPGTVAEKDDAMLPRAEVRSAFDAFFAECRGLVDLERQGALDRARERFMSAIDRR